MVLKIDVPNGSSRLEIIPTSFGSKARNPSLLQVFSLRMKRDRIRNAFATGLGLLLVAGAVLALGEGREERADFAFVNATEPQSLDPAVVTGVPEGKILRNLFEGLTVPGPKDLKALPGMAESWEISEDGKTYIFHIRKDAKWSNGDPLTAEDFRWSWQRFLEPTTGAQYAELFRFVVGAEDFYKGKSKDFSTVGIKTRGPFTLVVQLKNPTPFFLDLAGFYPLYPVHRPSVESDPKWNRPGHLVSNGPFLLKDRQIRDRILLAKNPFYWDRDNVHLNTVEILPVESKTTALNLYLHGIVDYLYDFPPSILPELRKRKDFHTGPYLGVYFYRINLKNKDPIKRKFLGDPRVRRALAMAMNRKSIVTKVTRNNEQPALHFVPPGIRNYKSPRLPGYNLLKAKSLIQEALRDLGLKKAPMIRILYNTNELHKDIAEVLQSQWGRDLGLSIRLENQEWGTYLNSVRLFDYDIARAAWIGDYVDPNTFLDMWMTGGGNNRTGYSNPKYDELIRLANKERDTQKRDNLFFEAESMLLQDLPVIPIYFYVSKYILNPKIKGFFPNLQDVHHLKFLRIERGNN
jgi:oligopeptide transport system substrate-binding protein